MHTIHSTPMLPATGSRDAQRVTHDDRRPRRAPSIRTAWARHESEVRAAQRLRHQVFADELGARMAVIDPGLPGHDIDRFDAHCEHLLVWGRATPDAPEHVVGTYRVLRPQGAIAAGGYYSESEFDLTPLQALRPTMLELGRSCVHPEWRHGHVIMSLWIALAAFMASEGLDTMVGCASVGMRDGGHHAATLWRQLANDHLVPPVLRVTPHLRLPVEALEHHHDVEPPPLIRAYLRCGARLLGEPAWDPDFNTADLPLLLRWQDLPERFKRAA